MGLAERVRRLERAKDEPLNAEIEAQRKRLGNEQFEAILREFVPEFKQRDSR
jgi:hypothetical protein